MKFFISLIERVSKKHPSPTKKSFKEEYRLLGGELVDDMLKDMEELSLISIEKSNGNITFKRKHEILK